MNDYPDIPQQLYDSDICFTMSSFLHDGFDVAIGVPPYFREVGHADSYSEACSWLQDAALRHYPNSVFTKKHCHGTQLV